MQLRAAALLLLAVGAAAFGQSADVGLVSMLSGGVVYVPPGGAPGKAKAFMKVREGDLFDVPAGAQLRVVYFEGSRQERWTGPVSFRAGRGSSEPLAGKPAEVARLPVGVPQRIARVPELMQNAKLAGTQIRGRPTRQRQASVEQKKAVTEARAVYEQMRSEMPADDITPELFLYAALYEYLLYDDMKVVADEMLRKQPGNEDVKALGTWVAGRTTR